MDTHVKRGEVYLQHQKHGEKWRRMWLVLYPSSRRGVARLEMSDADSGGDKLSVVRSRHPERRVVRLADCVSVVQLPPHAEACPCDNMAAFCVETEERRLIFAADRDACAEWVERVCQIAFPMDTTSNGDPQRQEMQMEVNEIYVSRDDLSQFKVTIQPTEASTRCGLKGAYWLHAGPESLVLKDLESHKCVLEWPYNLLRRYGRDKLVFLIEAGRRCDSGPGTFTFETRQGDDIFALIETAVQEQRSAVVAGTKRRPNSPLPSIPDSAILGWLPNDSNPKPLLVTNPLNAPDASKAIYTDPASVIGSSKPMQLNVPDDPDSPEIVYADPLDAIKAPFLARVDPPSSTTSSTPGYTKHSEPVYSSPVNCVCPPPDPNHSADDQSEPVYSEVCNETLPRQLEAGPREPGEGVYPPTGLQEDVKSGTSEDQPMEDPSALYSQVNKPPKVSQILSSQVSKPPKLSQTRHRLPHHGQLSPEVVYEDLGLI